MKTQSARLHSDVDDLTLADLEMLVANARESGAHGGSVVEATFRTIEVFIAEDGDLE